MEFGIFVCVCVQPVRLWVRGGENQLEMSEYFLMLAHASTTHTALEGRVEKSPKK